MRTCDERIQPAAQSATLRSRLQRSCNGTATWLSRLQRSYNSYGLRAFCRSGAAATTKTGCNETFGWLRRGRRFAVALAALLQQLRPSRFS
jgi:hypothetical protein